MAGIVLRALGVVCLAAGAVFLGADLWRWLAVGELRLAALGEQWFAVHPDSLQLLQPAIERHVSPALWDPYILTLLEWPAAAEFLALGALFLILGAALGPRRARRRR